MDERVIRGLAGISELPIDEQRAVSEVRLYKAFENFTECNGSTDAHEKMLDAMSAYAWVHKEASGEPS